jgi:glutamine synthetase
MIYFIGGVLKYVGELFLIYAPTINSYKRYKKNAFAPESVNSWSYESRYTSIRIVDSGKNLRIEFRISGADVNPYLLFSAIIASGARGIAEKISAPPYFRDNAHLDHSFIIPPPKNIYQAAEIFKKSDFAETILGRALKDFLYTNAVKEWDDYSNHISNFEVNRYLDLI